MQAIIKADLYRYIPEPYSPLTLIRGFRSKGFKYLFFRRKFRLCKKHNPFIFVYKIFLRHYVSKYGFQIGGKIGPGLYIGHFGTIIVNEAAIIGRNCNISPGVTIGVTRRGSKMGTPVIGNEVWIGTNAIIVGRIFIGNNVLIAPGSYVNFDVPDNSIVIGNPGIIKNSLKATEGYINNKYSG